MPNDLPRRDRSPVWARRVVPFLVCLTSGCAVLSPQRAAEEQVQPVLRLEVMAPTALAELLALHLDLGRVNRLADGEPLQDGELQRLLDAAPQQARDLLDTEGYYNAEVQFELVGRSERVENGEGSTSADLPTVRVLVNPGPRTQVRQVQLDVQGSLADDAADVPHARAATAALRRDWPLPAGSPFRDPDWSRAKTASIAGLRAQGYVQADWVATQARVDAAVQRADLSGTVASGPLFRVGPLRVEGLQVHDLSTVTNIAALRPGDPATEDMLLDIQERLQMSDLFDRVTVSLDVTPPTPEATPVVLRLGERQLQEATVGLGFAANLGARATLSHVHRRPFGQAWVARNAFDVAQRRQRWAGELSTHPLPGLYRNLVGGSLEWLESGSDLVRAANLRIGRGQETRRISRLAFVEWNRSTTTSALGREQADALSLQYHGVWRRIDDPVLPTLGHVWTGQVGVGQARSDPGGSGPFTRLYGRLDAFRPVGNWYGQGRVELGQVFARGDVLVPEALRFRAGGDDSVRGYGYRSLTRRVNDTEVGSEVLFTASAELARPILARLPALWGAVFVDIGNAAAGWEDLRPALGVGVGLRFRSPVGPLKLDLAYGEEVKQFRLHLTVGLAF